jgi:hypothetical protein
LRLDLQTLVVGNVGVLEFFLQHQKNGS